MTVHQIRERVVAQPEPWTVDMIAWLSEDWDGRYCADRMADWLAGWKSGRSVQHDEEATDG